MHWARRAASRAAWTAGRSRAISTAMIAMTTRSSMSVNPRRILRNMRILQSEMRKTIPHAERVDGAPSLAKVPNGRTGAPDRTEGRSRIERMNRARTGTTPPAPGSSRRMKQPSRLEDPEPVIGPRPHPITHTLAIPRPILAELWWRSRWSARRTRSPSWPHFFGRAPRRTFLPVSLLHGFLLRLALGLGIHIAHRRSRARIVTAARQHGARAGPGRAQPAWHERNAA